MLFPIGFLFHFRFSCRPHFITVHVSVATYQPAIWFFIKNIGKFWLHRRMLRPLPANSGTREIWLETAGRGFTHRLTHCYTVLYRIPVLIRLQLFRWLFYWLNHRKTLSPIAIKFAFNCIRDTRRLLIALSIWLLGRNSMCTRCKSLWTRPVSSSFRELNYLSTIIMKKLDWQQFLKIVAINSL